MMCISSVVDLKEGGESDTQGSDVEGREREGEGVRRGFGGICRKLGCGLVGLVP
jgi:hypothetical protein